MHEPPPVADRRPDAIVPAASAGTSTWSHVAESRPPHPRTALVRASPVAFPGRRGGRRPRAHPSVRELRRGCGVRHAPDSTDEIVGCVRRRGRGAGGTRWRPGRWRVGLLGVPPGSAALAPQFSQAVSARSLLGPAPADLLPVVSHCGELVRGRLSRSSRQPGVSRVTQTAWLRCYRAVAGTGCSTITSGRCTGAPSLSDRPAKLTVAQSSLSLSTVLRPSPLTS